MGTVFPQLIDFCTDSIQRPTLPMTNVLIFYPEFNETKQTAIEAQLAWGGFDHLWTPRDSVLRGDSRRNYHFFSSTMGKSSTLHCEVQLLDDQSTVLDLDVSFFYFVNEYFGCKMVDIFNVSLYAAMSLCLVHYHQSAILVILLWL